MKKEQYFCDGCGIQVEGWKDLKSIIISAGDYPFEKPFKEWKDRCDNCRTSILRGMGFEVDEDSV